MATIPWRDRLRLERTVWAFDRRLQNLPRRSRIARRRELRDNLHLAAGDVGAAAAVRPLGDLRQLATGYLAAEYDDWQPRPLWTRAAAAAVISGPQTAGHETLELPITKPLLISRRLVLTTLAGFVFVASLLVLGPLGLIPFGLLLTLGTDSDEEEPRRLVGLSARNLALATAMPATYALLWLWHSQLTTPTLVAIAGALISMPIGLRESIGEKTVAVTRRSVILAVWGLVIFVFLYQDRGVWLLGLATVCVLLPLVLAASRVRDAREGRLELGLLRRPFRRDVRPHLLQAGNIWLVCVLFAGVLAAGGTQHARILFSLTPAQFAVFNAVLTVGLILLPALALVPHRRVYAASNVVVALLSGFLALQLAQVSAPLTDVTVLDSPLTGEWSVWNGGSSVLLNGHSPNEAHSVDFMRLGPNGRTHTGGSDAPLSEYAGFGMPVLAPADGRVIVVTDHYPDNPVGTNSDYANHLVIDIGDGRFVSMAHLEQGSVQVRVGEAVRRGQPLAAVGNNGHSSQPHLHLQVQDSPAGFDAERTYPMAFRNVDIDRGGVWPWGDSRALRTGDLVKATTS